MIYMYVCDCGYKQNIKCSVKDMPAMVECKECGDPMCRDFKGEGGSFKLEGNCWAKDGYSRR